jgi:hypothetical protein
LLPKSCNVWQVHEIKYAIDTKHTMSFLSELKTQASALQNQQQGASHDLAANTAATEHACKLANKYLQDLCAQLNVIRPPAHGNYSLDGKTQFPALVLHNFRCDARKKMLRNAEAHDYIGVGWDIVPQTGRATQHSVTVNFPPDLERVTQRLATGCVPHERKEQRHPDTNKLLAYVFEYTTQASGSILISPNHDRGEVTFRVANVGGFEIVNATYPAKQVNQELMDELAKKLVGQGSRFG